MKKLVLLSLVVLLSFASCARRYTCPTYLQNEEPSKDVKAQYDAPEEEEEAQATQRN